MITIAGINDLGTIRRIAELTWPSTYLGIISQEQIDYMLEKMYNAQTLQQQMEQGHRFFLFLHGADSQTDGQGQPIGFAGTSREAGTTFKLHKLYVLPDIQGTGAGKALLEAVKNFARSEGGTHLVLQVNKLNKARSFYEKQGFSIAEEMIVELEHGFVMDDYLMQLELSV